MAVSLYRPFTDFDIAIHVIADEWLLYHTGTGQTHRLNGIVGEIFGCVWRSPHPIGIDGLKVSISDLLEADEIIKILESLLALHLIESVY